MTTQDPEPICPNADYSLHCNVIAYMCKACGVVCSNPQDYETCMYNKQGKKNMATKKKPYSKIENAKTLRSLMFEKKRNAKELAKAKAPEWFARLIDEANELTERTVKLDDFLYVQETKESESALSAEARAICPKSLKLLQKQLKAMAAYGKILDERIQLGFPKDPASPAPCKKAR